MSKYKQVLSLRVYRHFYIVVCIFLFAAICLCFLRKNDRRNYKPETTNMTFVILFVKTARIVISKHLSKFKLIKSEHTSFHRQNKAVLIMEHHYWVFPVVTVMSLIMSNITF